jgi:hypothetical protein
MYKISVNCQMKTVTVRNNAGIFEQYSKQTVTEIMQITGTVPVRQTYEACGSTAPPILNHDGSVW